MRVLRVTRPNATPEQVGFDPYLARCSEGGGTYEGNPFLQFAIYTSTPDSNLTATVYLQTESEEWAHSGSNGTCCFNTFWCNAEKSSVYIEAVFERGGHPTRNLGFVERVDGCAKSAFSIYISTSDSFDR